MHHALARQCVPGTWLTAVTLINELRLREMVNDRFKFKIFQLGDEKIKTTQNISYG